MSGLGSGHVPVFAMNLDAIAGALRRFLPSTLKRCASSLRQFSDYPRRIACLEQEIESLRLDNLFAKIVNRFHFRPDAELAGELEYLIGRGKIEMFPYASSANRLGKTDSGFDSAKGMCFVVHRGRRLYFPKEYDIPAAVKYYRNLVVTEGILGGGYSAKAPHQYLTDSFRINEGDTLLDVGAAEGLFLLDSLDSIKHGYAFESSRFWMEALNATFEPFRQKVTVVQKFVSNEDSVEKIRLDSFLQDITGPVLIKVDVEGGEQSVLDGAKSMLENRKNIRVVCCTYHKHDDAELVSRFFEERGYSTEFSSGYVIYYYDKQIRPPYFRRGLVRAQQKPR